MYGANSGGRLYGVRKLGVWRYELCKGRNAVGKAKMQLTGVHFQGPPVSTVVSGNSEGICGMPASGNRLKDPKIAPIQTIRLS